MIGSGGHASVVLECHVTGTVIAVGDNAIRRKIALEHPDEVWGTAIHPAAWVSPTAYVGAGSMITGGVIIHANARIGRHVIVNTCSSIDHDCQVGDYAQICPGARVCGTVTIGEGAFIGAGSIIKHGLKIGAWAVVAMGSVVIRDVQDDEVVGGNPAKNIKRTSTGYPSGRPK